MTEKRFKLAYEKGIEAIFEDLAHPYPRRMTNKEVENLLNEQHAENQKLREALKNSYLEEICENCKHGDYWIDEYYREGNFECRKKHFGNDHWKCDGLKECDDFELDIKLKR